MEQGIHAVVAEQKRDLEKVRLEVEEYVQNAMAGAREALALNQAQGPGLETTGRTTRRRTSPTS